jgi:hypothetical protein
MVPDAPILRGSANEFHDRQMAVSLGWIVIAFASAKAECAEPSGFDDSASSVNDASNFETVIYGLPEPPLPESTSLNALVCGAG